jgi:hypothetical protein
LLEEVKGAGQAGHGERLGQLALHGHAVGLLEVDQLDDQIFGRVRLGVPGDDVRCRR